MNAWHACIHAWNAPAALLLLVAALHEGRKAKHVVAVVVSEQHRLQGADIQAQLLELIQAALSCTGGVQCVA
jgi:hypothetical protein